MSSNGQALLIVYDSFQTSRELRDTVRESVRVGYKKGVWHTRKHTTAIDLCKRLD